MTSLNQIKLTQRVRSKKELMNTSPYFHRSKILQRLMKIISISREINIQSMMMRFEIIALQTMNTNNSKLLAIENSCRYINKIRIKSFLLKLITIDCCLKTYQVTRLILKEVLRRKQMIFWVRD